MNIPKLALITGASSGIGKATARLLARKNIALILTGRNEEELDKLKEELSFLTDVKAVTADLSTIEGREILIRLIQRELPDLIINNAGYGLYGECLSYSTSEQLGIIDVNIIALTELTLEGARALISRQKSGTIVNISSIVAFQAYPDLAVYAATKAYVNSFSEALNYEIEPYGISVLTLCPGRVATGFRKRAGEAEENAGLAKFDMEPDEIAKEIWQQIISGKTIKIVNWKYRIFHWISSFIPSSFRLRWIKQSISKQIKPRNFLPTKYEL